MFIKAMFILWVIIQSGTCLSADLNNSDICWIEGVVIAKLKKIYQMYYCSKYA